MVRLQRVVRHEPHEPQPLSNLAERELVPMPTPESGAACIFAVMANTVAIESSEAISDIGLKFL
jgi:hypothetical protein